MADQKGNDPDFMIIGAMKCATSTLHDQLAHQGFFMTTPKEPNFFSDDDIYAKGMKWYRALFAGARQDQIKGESSTHYTKLNTYTQCVSRLKKAYPKMKFIYVMRHPIDRLVSQYIHEWTQGNISEDINDAILKYPSLVEYSCYSMQLRPYVDNFGPDSVLLLFAERLKVEPVIELESIYKFLGINKPPAWDRTIKSNVSSERLRVSGWRDFLINLPVLRELRIYCIPKTAREWIKGFWRMKERPQLTAESSLYLEEIFDADLRQLGEMTNCTINCKNFRNVVLSPHDFRLQS